MIEDVFLNYGVLARSIELWGKLWKLLAIDLILAKAVKNPNICRHFIFCTVQEFILPPCLSLHLRLSSQVCAADAEKCCPCHFFCPCICCCRCCRRRCCGCCSICLYYGMMAMTMMTIAAMSTIMPCRANLPIAVAPTRDCFHYCYCCCCFSQVANLRC